MSDEEYDPTCTNCRDNVGEYTTDIGMFCGDCLTPVINTLRADLAAARERAERAEAENALLFDYWPRDRWDGTLIPGDLKMSGKQTWCIRTPEGIKGPFATPIDAIRFYLAQQANAAAGITQAADAAKGE